MNFLKGCAGKTKYKGMLEAEYCLENHHSDRMAEVYPCKHCGYYHIGTSGKKVIVNSKKNEKQKKSTKENKPKVRKFKY